MLKNRILRRFVGLLLILFIQIGFIYSFEPNLTIPKQKLPFIDESTQKQSVKDNSTNYTTEDFSTSLNQVLYEFKNETYMRQEVKHFINNNDSCSSLCSAIPGYTHDEAYEMINVDKAHNELEQIFPGNNNAKYPGKDVTVALVDTGVHPHSSLMWKPDGSLRSITYIDCNFYRYSNLFWYVYVYEATKFCVTTEDRWKEDWLDPRPYDPTHPNLDERSIEGQYEGIYDGWVFPGDTNGHGTSVAGAFLRMAPYANLIIADFMDANSIPEIDGKTPPNYPPNYMWEWILHVLHSWCDPDIVSCSWGKIGSWSSLTNEIDDLTADGRTVIVASTGNDGGAIRSPASFSKVVAVGSVYSRYGVDTPPEYKCAPSQVGTHFPDSNYGSQTEVVAPGRYVYVPTQSDLDENDILDDFQFRSGTSFSAPLVSGDFALFYQAFALMMSYYPTMASARNFVKYTCDQGGQDTNPNDRYYTYSRQNDKYGHGIIDVWETLMDLS